MSNKNKKKPPPPTRNSGSSRRGDKSVKSPMSKQVELSPAFKYAFIFVAMITLLSFLTIVFVTISYPDPTSTSRIDTLLDLLKLTFTSGFGAVVGLMGGKSL